LALITGLIGFILASLFRGGGKEAFAEGLGFTLALISIAGVLKTAASLALLGPLLTLGLPLGTASLPLVYGEVQRSVILRVFRSYGLLIYLATSCLSVGLLLLARAPRPPTILILGGITVGGVLLWRWSRTAHDDLTATGNHLWLFKVPLARLGLAEAVDRLELRLHSGEQTTVATPDTAAVMRAQRDSRLLEAYRRADLVTPDGIGLVWASHLLDASLPQ
ncbi:MAG: hypothetical protein GWO44_03760, partial [Thermoplasmata archaeon]|nr:hypothetical protein [Thermoplasmata archaeon]NIY02408.1 hypothetical protein [Thermoplasmata archaeon]